MGGVPRLSDKERVVLDLLVANGETYGLQMVKASKGALKRGAVYVILMRMEDHKGLVSSWEEIPAEGGPPRRYYRITAHGKRVYNATLAQEQAFRMKLVPEGGVS